MAKNYTVLTGSVITTLDGVDNTSAVTHCITRSRFVIKDGQLIDGPALRATSDVLGVVRNDNQYQVTIGNTVLRTFQEAVNLLPGGL